MAPRLLRGIDHVAIAVRDAREAVEYFGGTLGLDVVHRDVLRDPPVVLTYLDASNAYVQLIEPRDPNSELARWIDVRGEGIHHVCFGVDDVAAAARALASAGPPAPLGHGRGRVSSFVVNGDRHGVLLELTEWPAGSNPRPS
jgi:methylmalonyl-CoA/ethylmalonyl-CoA epimerase